MPSNQVPERIALALTAANFAVLALCDELCGGTTCFKGDNPERLADSAMKLASLHFLEMDRPDALATYRACLAAFDCELLEEPDHAE